MLFIRRRTEQLLDGAVVENTNMLSMGPVMFEVVGAIQALSQQAEVLEQQVADLERQLAASPVKSVA